LKQIVENTVDEKSDVESGENETFFLGEEEPKSKRKQSNTLFDNSLITTSTPVKSMLKRSKTVPSNLSEASKILQRKLSYEHSHAPSVEKIFEVADKSCVIHSTLVANVRGTRKVVDTLWPIGTKIIWE